MLQHFGHNGRLEVSVIAQNRVRHRIGWWVKEANAYIGQSPTRVRWQEGWAGRRFHLGSNNEVFEVFAIYQALRIF